MTEWAAGLVFAAAFFLFAIVVLAAALGRRGAGGGLSASHPETFYRGRPFP